MTLRRLLGRTLALAALVPFFVNVGPRAGAQTDDAADVAVDHLQDNAAAFGLTATDVSDVRVVDAVVSSHTGVTHVYIQQLHRGIPVTNGIVNVNVAGDGTVLSAGNRFVAGLSVATAGQESAPAALRTPVQATAAAARHVNLATTERLVVVDQEPGPNRETTVSDGGISEEAIPAELVWLPLDSGDVRLAWTVEIEQTDGQHWWVISVDAATGAVLRAEDRLVHDDLGALAGMLGRRSDSVRVAPERTVKDGSSYRVFPLPLESPSDGDRSLVKNPAAANASPFGWHDTNGAARTGVHAHARQQRPRLRRPRQQQRARSGHRSRRRRGPRLRLPARPDAAAARLPRRRRHEPLLLEQHRPRRPLPARLRRGGGQLPGQQLRQGRPGQRRRAGRGAGRQRPQQRQLRDAASTGIRPRMQMFEWRSSAAEPDRGAPPVADRRDVLRPDGRASARASSPPGRSRARSSTSAAAATRPTRPGSRSTRTSPSGGQDRADRPRQLHLRREGEEGPGPGRADGDRREQRPGAGHGHGRRRPDDHDPVGHGDAGRRESVPRQRPVQRDDLGRHGRRARPRLRPRRRRHRARVRPRLVEPAHRRPGDGLVPRQRRSRWARAGATSSRSRSRRCRRHADHRTGRRHLRELPADDRRRDPARGRTRPTSR